MKQSSKRGKLGSFFTNDKKNVWMLYIAFLLFNIIFAIQYRAPFAYPDEYGVFAAGNWMLGGVDWAYKSNMYYGYTFSPFVGILMRLFHTICPVYIGALCIKALQLSLIPALSYKVLHEVLEVDDVRVKMLLATTISLYPSLTLYAKYVSNETSLHVTLFICFYLVAQLAVGQSKNTTRLYSALLGFFAVFAYASHGMGLAFIVAACLVVLVSFIGTKKNLVSYPFFFASLVVFYLLDAKIKDLVMNAVYYIPESGMANTFTRGFNGLISSVTRPTFIRAFFNMFASRLFYISAATFGMFPLALTISLIFLWRFVKARFTGKLDASEIPLFVATAFGIIIFLCGIGLSTLNNVPSLESPSRMYFYGRYYEYMGLPLILVGLTRLFKRDVKKMELLKYFIASFMCYLALTLYTRFRVMPFVSSDLNRFFVLGIIPFIGNTNAEFNDITGTNAPLFDLFAIWLISVSVFLVAVYLLKGKRRLWALVIVSGMFLYGIFFGHIVAVRPLSVANYNYFYSNMEPIESALSEFKYLYDQYPKLYVVTTKLGAAESNSSLVRGRAQMSFFKYSVKLVLSINELDYVTDAEEWFRDSIIVSDQDLAYFNEDDAYLKIYESPNARIWIRGEEIRGYYNNRKT